MITMYFIDELPIGTPVIALCNKAYRIGVITSHIAMDLVLIDGVITCVADIKYKINSPEINRMKFDKLSFIELKKIVKLKVNEQKKE